MSVFFCTVSGERIASPGISKNHGGDAEPVSSSPAPEAKASKAEDKSPEPEKSSKGNHGASAPKDKR